MPRRQVRDPFAKTYAIGGCLAACLAMAVVGRAQGTGCYSAPAAH